MILRDLLDVWPLAPLAAGVAVLVLFGRDKPAANEHDLSDYHAEPTAELEPRRHAPAPIPAQRRPWAEMNAKPDLDELRERFTAGLKSGRPELLGPRMAVTERDILPPAPPGMNAGSPLYAETLFESWRRETPADTAGRFLREIGDSERAKAGIRPVTSPATDRDYTGSFPVVAVA